MIRDLEYIVPLSDQEYPINKTTYQYDESFYTGSLSHTKGAVLISKKSENAEINRYLSLTHKWFSEFTQLNPVVSEKERVKFLAPVKIFKRRTIPENHWLKSAIDSIGDSFCGPEMSSSYLVKSVKNLNNNVILKMTDDGEKLHSILTFYFSKNPPNSEGATPVDDKYHLYIEAFCGNQPIQIDASEKLTEAMNRELNAQTEEEKEIARRDINSAKYILNKFKGGIVLIYRLIDLCVYLGIKSIVLDALTSKKTIDAYVRAGFKKPDEKNIIKRDLKKRMLTLKRKIEPSTGRILPLTEEVPRMEELTDIMTDLTIRPSQNLISITGESDGLYIDKNEIEPTTRFLTIHIDSSQYKNYKTRSGREVRFPTRTYADYEINPEDIKESIKRRRTLRHKPKKSKPATMKTFTETAYI